MAKNNLLMVIGVALVVAVIASVATVAITGNYIKVNQNKFGNYKVYTVDEIDTKLKNVATYEGVLEMIGDATSTGQIRLGSSQRDNKPIIVTNGRTECGTKKCLIGFGGIVFPNTNYFNYDVEGILSCDETLDLNQLKTHQDWIDGSMFIVQYLCTEL